MKTKDLLYRIMRDCREVEHSLQKKEYIQTIVEVRLATECVLLGIKNENTKTSKRNLRD